MQGSMNRKKEGLEFLGESAIKREFKCILEVDSGIEMFFKFHVELPDSESINQKDLNEKNSKTFHSLVRICFGENFYF